MSSKISDIAKKAKVSPSTVSMILNRKKGFSYSQSTINRVLKTARQLDYQPNPVAKLMRLKETNMVGIAVQPDNSYTGYESSRFCADQIRKLGYEPVLINLLEANDYSDSILFNRLDLLRGIICLYPNQERKAVSLCSQKGYKLPIISLFRKISDSPIVREVFSDHFHAFQEAVKFLYSLNHRNIAYVGTKIETEFVNCKRDGFIASVKEFKINKTVIELKLNENQKAFEIGELAANKKVFSKSKISGVICANDEIALGLMSTLMKKGIKIPDDISVIGYDDVPFAAYTFPGLTTFQQKLNDLTEAAVKLLISCAEANDLQNDLLPESLSFNPELIVRNSTKKIR